MLLELGEISSPCPSSVVSSRLELERREVDTSMSCAFASTFNLLASSLVRPSLDFALSLSSGGTATSLSFRLQTRHRGFASRMAAAASSSAGIGKRLFLFDFDGVVCDSCDEVSYLVPFH